MTGSVEAISLTKQRTWPRHVNTGGTQGLTVEPQYTVTVSEGIPVTQCQYAAQKFKGSNWASWSLTDQNSRCRTGVRFTPGASVHSFYNWEVKKLGLDSNFHGELELLSSLRFFLHSTQQHSFSFQGCRLRKDPLFLWLGASLSSPRELETPLLAKVTNAGSSTFPYLHFPLTAPS